MNKKLSRNTGEWFENWFDEWYLKVYRHRDHTEAAEFIDRLPIWGDIFEGDRCLDLGCGTGRHTKELAKRGLQVIGLDLSMTLLQVAITEIEGKLNRSFVRADMRKLPINAQFSLVVSLFTSFGYFKTDMEHLELLKSIGAIIKPSGFFILDLPNPKTVIENVSSRPVSVSTIDGVEIREERWIDHTEGRVLKKISINSESVEKLYFESVRLFEREELEQMMQLAGISISHLWGDYLGATFRAESPRMVHFGVKNG
jgi:SAM-dependent methyltransferase